MSAAEETPIKQTTANGVTTAFPFDFTVLEADDLVVTGDLGGVAINYDVNIDYTLSGLGTNAGAVVFISTPANGTIITIQRSTKLKRSVDYQTAGDLPSDTLDLDIDRVWYALQDLNYGSGSVSTRSLRVPFGETIPALPSAISRALKGLYFDASGNPTLVPPLAGDASALALLLASYALPTQGAGMVGYDPGLTYPANTVGAALAAGSSDVFSVVQYGAVADGATDARSAFDDAIAAAVLAGGGRVYVPAGTYYLDSAVPLESNIELFGDGRGSVLKLKPGISGLVINAKSHVAVRNLRITSTAYSSLSGLGGVLLDGSNNCTIEGVHMDGLSCVGVLLQDASYNTVKHNRFSAWRGATGVGTLGVQDSSDVAMWGNSAANDVFGNYCMSGNDIGVSIQNRYTQSTPIANNVHGNYCYNQNAYGILVYNGCWNPATDGPTYGFNPPFDFRTIVRGNHVWGVRGNQLGGLSGAGIYLQSAGGTICTHNVVWDCCKSTTNFDTQAIGHITAVVGTYAYGELHEIVVANNRINAPQGPGIWVATSSVPVLVENNSIYCTSTAATGRQDGIRVTNAIPKLRGNDIRFANTNFAAISINASGGFVCDAPEVSGQISTPTIGLAFNPSGGATFTNINLHDLTVRGCSSTALQLNGVVGGTVNNIDLESTGTVFTQTNCPRVKFSSNRFYSPAVSPSIIWAGSANGNLGTVVDETNDLDGLVEHDVGSGGVITQYRTAFPTTGIWEAGDRVINLTPSVGQPNSWRCTVGGTSGTWESEGTLGSAGGGSGATMKQIFANGLLDIYGAADPAVGPPVGCTTPGSAVRETVIVYPDNPTGKSVNIISSGTAAGNAMVITPGYQPWGQGPVSIGIALRSLSTTRRLAVHAFDGTTRTLIGQSTLANTWEWIKGTFTPASGANWVIELSIWDGATRYSGFQAYCGGINVVKGAVPPNTVEDDVGRREFITFFAGAPTRTPDFTGQWWRDTAAQVWYKAAGQTGAVDWRLT